MFENLADFLPAQSLAKNVGKYFEKMIKSDKTTYNRSPKIYLFFGILFLVSAIFLIYKSIQNNEFINSSIFYLLIGILLIFLSRKLKEYFHLVEINAEKVIYIKSNQRKEILWSEILMIGRIPLTTKYIIKTNNETIIFPTDYGFGFVSLNFLVFIITWDNSDMGKFIKKMRKNKNIMSPLKYFLKLKHYKKH